MKLKVLLLIAQGFLRKKSVTNAKRILPNTTRNGKGFKHAAAYGILRNETKRNETKWYFAKWYFAKRYFAKWYFAKRYFAKRYFAKWYFAKRYFAKWPSPSFTLVYFT